MDHTAPPSYLRAPLFLKGAGIFISLSPLSVWLCWKTMPSLAFLAPLAVTGAMAGITRLFTPHVRQTLGPILPPIRSTLAAGLSFTAVCLLSLVALILLPQGLAAMGIVPLSPLVALGLGNLFINLCALILLSAASLYSCRLCFRK